MNPHIASRRPVSSRLPVVAALLFCLGSIGMFAAENYHVHVSLRNIRNDRVHVEVRTPTVSTNEATFVFPATIPGTYEQQNWWRFVRGFQAFDDKGNQLQVRRSADSQFVIAQARRLAKVTYDIDDSFDDRDTSHPDIFPPAGTDIEADSLFVINHGGFVGYIDGMQKRPYTIRIDKPRWLYGATALAIKALNDSTDEYGVASYDELVDSPVLYSRPDTATFTVAGVKVLVALAHRGSEQFAPRYAVALAKVTQSIGKFLPTMPVDRYAFLFYLWNGDTNAVSKKTAYFGALEHSYSSFYFWQKTPMTQGVDETAAHEFLHILVPLTLHSEEIEKFDFRNPRMSKHLWLYEGVTEYFAHLAQLHDSTITEQVFMNIMKVKSRSLNILPHDFSLTSFSKNVLTPENQHLYPLIYEYGALNGFLMDILLRSESKGKQGIRDLIYTLSAKYGRSRAFDDDSLFAEIGRVTSPAVADYCRKYIDGTARIPVKDMLARIGWTFDSVRTVQALTFDIHGDFVQEESVSKFVLHPGQNNPLGIKDGDALVKVDGKTFMEVDRPTWERLVRPATNDYMTITVSRGGEEVTLTGVPVMGERKDRNVFEVDANATDAQKALRNSVFYQ